MTVRVSSVPSALSYTQVDLRLGGERFLDLSDANLGTLGIPVAGLVGGLVMAWFTSKPAIVEEIERRARARGNFGGLPDPLRGPRGNAANPDRHGYRPVVQLVPCQC